MRILITGGCGFLGAHIVEHFLRSTDAALVVLDKMTYASSGFDRLRDIAAFDDKRVHVLGCDVSQPIPLGVAREVGDVDYVIHAAAETHVDNSITDPLPFLQSNVIGTHHLLWWLRSVKSLKRAFLVSCYDEVTRALTSEGLKRYDELQEGDIVFGLDDERRLVAQPIQKVIIQDYEGEMIYFQNSRVDFVVTPNHRMYGANEEDHTIVEEAEVTAQRTVPLKMLRPRRWLGLKLSTVHVDDVGDLDASDVLYLCGLFIGNGFVSDQVKTTLNKSGLSFKEMVRQCRDPITGRMISRPGIGSQSIIDCHSYRTFFDIPTSDPARARLCATLTQLGIKYSCHSGKAGEHVYVGGKAWSSFFRQFGKGAANVRIPRWILDLDRSLLLRLFDGLIGSNGHEQSTPQYTTISEGLVGDMFELGLKLGFLPRVEKHYNENVIVDDYDPDGRKISGEAFYLYFSKKLDPEIVGDDAKAVPYKGKVWCLTVATKNFFIERNGRIALSGNTDEVYGPASLYDKSEAFDENAKFRPANPYAAAKAGGEAVGMAYANTFKIPLTIVSTMNLVGERQHFEKMVPKCIRSVLLGETMIIHADPSRTRAGTRFYLHCRTYAHALGFLIDLDKRNSSESAEVQKQGMPLKIHVCGEREISNLDLAQFIASIVGKPLKYDLVDFHSSRPGHDLAYRMKDELIRSLGWQRPMNLEQSLEKTVRWYLANPKWLGLSS